MRRARAFPPDQGKRRGHDRGGRCQWPAALQQPLVREGSRLFARGAGKHGFVRANSSRRPPTGKAGGARGAANRARPHAGIPLPPQERQLETSRVHRKLDPQPQGRTRQVRDRQPRHHRAPGSGESAAGERAPPDATDGGGGTAVGRDRPRLQQPFGRDDRLYRHSGDAPPRGRSGCARPSRRFARPDSALPL